MLSAKATKLIARLKGKWSWSILGLTAWPKTQRHFSNQEQPVRTSPLTLSRKTLSSFFLTLPFVAESTDTAAPTLASPWPVFFRATDLQTAVRAAGQPRRPRTAVAIPSCKCGKPLILKSCRRSDRH